MKVLFAIDIYRENAGASIALMEYIKANEMLEDPVIFCKKRISGGSMSAVPVIESTGEEIIEYYLDHNYQCIHYFRADGRKLFYSIIKNANNRKLNIPVLTTVCQKPSVKRYFYQPREISHTKKIVFIDRASYNDSLYSFIPEDNKQLNYFGACQSHFDATLKLNSEYKENTNCLTIGRASTLNKCTDDMFEVFDKISDPKKIVILGSGSQQQEDWIKGEIEKRKGKYEIIWKGGLPYNEYLREINKFDIFFYYIPQNAHSSIDGTIGDAMLLQKPCVYCGPKAPAERLDKYPNGFNGFLAHNADEVVEYVNLLMGDSSLRLKMGIAARQTAMNDFPMTLTVKTYNRCYAELISKLVKPCKIPVSFMWYYFTRICIATYIPYFFKAAVLRVCRKLNIPCRLDLWSHAE